MRAILVLSLLLVAGCDEHQWSDAGTHSGPGHNGNYPPEPVDNRALIVAALGDPGPTQETDGTIYDVWYITGTDNTELLIEVLWRHDDNSIFYQNGNGPVSAEYSVPRWMRAEWFVDFAPVLVPGQEELSADDASWLVDHPLALGVN